MASSETYQQSEIEGLTKWRHAAKSLTGNLSSMTPECWGQPGAVTLLSPDGAQPAANVAHQGESEEVPGPSCGAHPSGGGRNGMAQQQEGGGNRYDEARQGPDSGRGLGEAYRAGVRQHPGKQGGQKIESSKNAAGERSYKIAT
jgi:hypothetical protein